MGELEKYKLSLQRTIDKNINDNSEIIFKTLKYINEFESFEIDNYYYREKDNTSIHFGLALSSIFPSFVFYLKELLNCIIVESKIPAITMNRIITENYILLMFLYQNREFCETYYDWTLYFGEENYNNYIKKKVLELGKITKIVEEKREEISQYIYDKKISDITLEEYNIIENIMKSSYGWAYLKFKNRLLKGKNISLRSLGSKCKDEINIYTKENIFSKKEYNMFGRDSKYVHNNDIITKQMSTSFSNIEKVELIYLINKWISKYIYIYAMGYYLEDEKHEKITEIFDGIKFFLNEIEEQQKPLIEEEMKRYGR